MSTPQPFKKENETRAYVPVYCPSCGKPNPPDLKLCNNCGASISAGALQPSPEGPKPPQPKPHRSPTHIYYSIIGIAVLIAVFIIAPYIISSGPPPIARKCTFTGYVLAGATDDYRVTNATVEVEIGGSSYSTTTDEWGRYSMKVPMGRWVVRVKIGDSVRYSENLQVSVQQLENNRLNKNIYNVVPELSSGDGGSIGNVRVVYIPGKSLLSGYTFAGAGREYRLTGVTVEVEVRGAVYSTKTGGSGEYNLEAPTGNWTVRVKIGDSVKRSETMAVSLDQPTVIREWYNVAPELIPDRSTDGVRCVYVESGWRRTQVIRL